MVDSSSFYTTLPHSENDDGDSDEFLINEYLSALIPWVIFIHNVAWCAYTIHTLGCCKNKYSSISTGMRRSALLVFISHAIAPFFMGFSNFYAFIKFYSTEFGTEYPCNADFIAAVLLYALCKVSLFLFFTFRVDVILRDSHFAYKRMQSWLLRLLAFIAYLALNVSFVLYIRADIDDDNDFCHLEQQSVVPLFVGTTVNALLFTLVICIFARKICQVTSRDQPSVNASVPFGQMGLAYSRSYGANASHESMKLIETLQYHTLLIAYNVLGELLLLVLAAAVGSIGAICLSLSLFCDIWCLLLMFRRAWFQRYCNCCLKCTQPLWRCCGVHSHRNEYELAVNAFNRNISDPSNYVPSAVKTQHDESYYHDPQLTMYTQSGSTMRNSVYRQPSDSKSKGIWNMFTSKRQPSSRNNELYQPLVEQTDPYAV